ncbi:hypothetical protein [Kitasatospora sp. NPDC097691]|uniref:hypothetical protein n=1 Tax=Kitasatospora sp. NPDC097691 TaxID=3157231 RepID=UPI0033341EA9
MRRRKAGLAQPDEAVAAAATVPPGADREPPAFDPCAVRVKALLDGGTRIGPPM